MTLAYLIIILVVFQLFFYVGRLLKHDGIYIDYWLLSILTTILPCLLVYPYAGDEGNIAAVGDSLYDIKKYLSEAFGIVVIGYFSMWMGKCIYDRFVSSRGLSKFDKKVYFVISSSKCRKMLVLLYAPFILIIFCIGIINLGSDIRVIAGRSSLLRIVYNIASTTYPMFMSVILAFYFQTKNHRYLLWLFFMFGLSLLFSARSLSFGVWMNAFLFYVITKGKNIKLMKIILAFCLIISGVFWLGFFRNGEVFSLKKMYFDVIYGNTFSDIRDFAWILSGWDHELLLGKTYFSGLMSFIPSSFWDFRAEWSWGHISCKLAGLIIDDDSFHGGLRGTIFAEPYLNFGYIGVIIFSNIYGFYLEKINRKVKRFIKEGNFIYAYSSMFKSSFLFLIMISAASFKLYSVLLPILLLYEIKHKKHDIR